MTDPDPDLSRPIVAFRHAVDLIAAGHPRGARGVVSFIAALVGISRQGAHQVLSKSGALCPAAWVVPLAKATGVPRSALRPDLYPAADDPDLKARRAPTLTPAALERAGQLCIPGTERKRGNG